eukprot:12540389-Alexandrium_andersonii.AAC.1
MDGEAAIPITPNQHNPPILKRPATVKRPAAKAPILKRPAAPEKRPGAQKLAKRKRKSTLDSSSSDA